LRLEIVFLRVEMAVFSVEMLFLIAGGLSQGRVRGKGLPRQALA
jgi:hypothetical protein